MIFSSAPILKDFCNKRGNMDDQELAYILFRDGVTQKQIASVFKKSEQTIAKWKKDGNWEARKTQSATAMCTAQEDVQEILTYQLSTLKKIKDSLLDNPQPTLISKGAIDGIRDLFNCAKEKQIEWTQYVRVVREINRYLSEEDLSLAQQVAEPLDNFLNYKRKQLQ